MFTVISFEEAAELQDKATQEKWPAVSVFDLESSTVVEYTNPAGCSGTLIISCTGPSLHIQRG